MHIFQKPTLIAYLQFAYNIKALSDRELSKGICNLFNGEKEKHNKVEMPRLHGDEMYLYLIRKFKSWKGFSGINRYPIELYQNMGSMHQFDCCRAHYRKTWWKRMCCKDRNFANRYTRLRRALLDHIISELEHEING